jgi:hypothetical protein
MPYQRPGPSVYVTNDTAGTIAHGSPVQEDDFVGIAVKQKAVGWAEGLAAQAVIQPGEDYLILHKGVVQVDTVSGFAKGDDVYIAAASVTDGVTTYALSETDGAQPFGKVIETVADGRGVPTGKVRIDLDAKDSVVPV